MIYLQLTLNSLVCCLIVARLARPGGSVLYRMVCWLVAVLVISHQQAVSQPLAPSTTVPALDKECPPSAPCTPHQACPSQLDKEQEYQQWQIY